MNFLTIPAGIRSPGQYVEIDNSRALAGLPGMPHRILVLGQRLASGQVAAGVTTQITSETAAIDAFGQGSMLHAMLKGLLGANPRTETWVLAQDEDIAGVAATGNVTFTGPATKAGVVALYVSGHLVKVGVANGDTAEAIATTTAAAINALDDLPVTAAVNGTVLSQVDITCRWKGATGDFISVMVNYHTGDQLPLGVGVTITDMSNGASNPDLSGLAALMGDEWYHTLVVPYTDGASLTAVESELSSRFDGMRMIEGHAFAAIHGTQGEMSSLGDSRNNPHLTVIGAGKSPTAPWVWAAVLAGVEAAQTQMDPARPRQTVPLPGLLPAPLGQRLTNEEREFLLHDGISSFKTDPGGVCRIERLITTYKTNAQGMVDTSYLDVTTMRTLAYLRYSVRALIALRYPRHKLADDGTTIAPGQAIVTPATLRADLVGLARDWEAAGLIEGVDQFKNDLQVVRDGSDPNRVNAILPPDLINGLRVFAASVQFRS